MRNTTQSVRLYRSSISQGENDYEPLFNFGAVRIRADNEYGHGKRRPAFSHAFKPSSRWWF
jgi:hypothetical protein